MTVLLRPKCLPGLQRLTLELAAIGSTKLKTLELRPLPLPRDGAMAAPATIAGRLASRDAFAGSPIIHKGSTTLLSRSWGVAISPSPTHNIRHTHASRVGRQDVHQRGCVTAGGEGK